MDCCRGNIPTVSAEAESDIANSKNQVVITPASDDNNYTATINRKGSNINYYVHFNLIDPPAIPTVTSIPVCAPVAQNATMTAYSEGASDYRWYNSMTATASEAIYTGNAYSVYIFGTATYYVSAINSIGCESAKTAATAIVAAPPAIPTAGNTTPVCSGGTGIFTATLPAGDNLICRWYATNSSTEVLGTCTSLEVSNLTQNTTRYAETYNSITGCYSGRTAVTVNVNSAPAVPTNLAGGSRCGAGTVSLSATPAAGTICQWFAAETGGNALGSGNSFTTPSIANTTNYYVASYNENTGCSSARQLVTATINDLPAAPTAGNTTAVCPGEDGIFTATLPSGDNLQCRWYETSNSETVLSTATSLTVNNLTQNTSRFVSTT